MSRSTYFAKKTLCSEGHSHASAKEAKRCGELHLLQRSGAISGLFVEPVYQIVIDGRPVKMANGHIMQFKPDWRYIEDGKTIIEDCKARNAHMSRDVPVKIALLKHLWPDIVFRIS